MLHLPDRTPEFRACIALLGITSVYPLEAEVRELTAYLTHGRAGQAGQFVIEAAVDLGKMAMRRVLVPAAQVQIDVTSVSRETAMTGIPRVVVSLIRGAGDAARLHVWSHGTAGPATMLEDGTFEFDPDVWSGVRSGTWPYSQLRHLHRRLRAASATSVLASILYRIVLVLGRPFLGRLNGGAGPLVGILFGDGEIMLPEVCQPDVADRLLTWRRSVGRGTLRVLVHDLLPVTTPQYFQAGHPELFLSYLRVVAGADVVVTTTPYTARQVHALARLFAVPEPVTLPVALPVTAREWDVAPVEAGYIPQFTCIGSLEPRKNHRAVLKACTDLAGRSYPVILHLVGNKAWADDEIREQLVRAKYAGVDVRLVSTATDAELKGLMSASVATIFVSWAEGYGLPVLESLACGVPVIGSDVEPIRDFAQYGGMVLVDPHDHIALADAMLALLADPKARDRLAATIRADAIPTSITDWAAAVLAPVQALAGGDLQLSTG